MRQGITVPSLLLVLLSVSSQAFALGLGDINVTSRLNQRYEAQIPVLVAADIDADELTVKLASRTHFERAGLERGINALALKFEPKRLSADQMVIVVRSREPVREPLLQFIVEIEHNGSRSIRQYTTFLDKPNH